MRHRCRRQRRRVSGRDDMGGGLLRSRYLDRLKVRPRPIIRRYPSPSSNDPQAMFRCSLDSAPAADCDSPYPIYAFADGKPHLLGLRCRYRGQCRSACRTALHDAGTAFRLPLGSEPAAHSVRTDQRGFPSDRISTATANGRLVGETETARHPLLRTSSGSFEAASGVSGKRQSA